MNVLVIGPDKDAKGGIATVIKNFYDKFEDSEIKLFYMFSWKERRAIYNLIIMISCILKLPYILKKNNIRCVHIHVAQDGSFYRKSLFALISRGIGVRVIFHIHASQFDKFYNKKGKNGKLLIKNMLKLPNDIIVLSSEWKKVIFNITDKENIKIIENAVSLAENNKYNPNGKIITFFGRIGERKGIYDLLDISSELFKKHPEYKLIICGDGEVEKVKKMIRDKNISKNVEFIGWVNNEQKIKLFEQAVVNVLPSYHEGMPMAILETMAFGIPNISTYVGGIPQVINKDNGYLIHAGNKEELLDSVDKILSNFNLRKKLSENSYKTIKERYDIKAFFDKWKKIYRLS